MVDNSSNEVARRYYKIHTFEDNYTEYPSHGEDLVHLNPAGTVQRFWFRFTSPSSDLIFADQGNLDNRANRSFLARLYWGGRSTNQVAIIFNGLDETIHQFRTEADTFRFYDELGTHLAEQDILAVLLPTPYHLNRVPCFFDREKERHERKRRGYRYRDLTIPTEALLAGTHRLYRNHFQGFKETIALCRYLDPDRTAPAFPGLVFRTPPVSETTLDLFGLALRPPLRISLVGYSLGGLRALTEYLHDRHDAEWTKREPLFSACVAINSGGSLCTLPPPPWVDPSGWRRLVDRLLRERLQPRRRENRFSDLRLEEKDQAETHFVLLDDVFFGTAPNTNKLAWPGSEKILFVLGGRDDLVPLQSLERFTPATGLNLLRAAGISSLFPYDPDWDNWKQIVFDIIRVFINTSGRPSRASTDLKGFVKLVSLLDHELGLLPYSANLKEKGTFAAALDILEGERQRGRLVERILGTEGATRIADTLAVTQLRMDELVVEYIQGLLAELELNVQLGRCHPGQYRTVRRSLLLGALARVEGVHVGEALSHLLESKQEPIGSLLVKSGLMTEQKLIEVLASQAQTLDDIRSHLAHQFRSFALARIVGIPAAPLKTCFVSAPTGLPLDPLRASLRSHGIRELIPHDLSTGPDWASEIQKQLSHADLVIGVLPSRGESQSVLFDLGQARARGKRILIIAPPSSEPTPLSLQRSLVLRTDLNNRQAIDFALDQVSSAPLDHEERFVSKQRPLRPLGRKAVNLIGHLDRFAPSGDWNSLKAAVASALRDCGADVVAEAKESDIGADLAVWSDVLEPVAGNPLLIDIKLPIKGKRAADRAIHELQSYLGASASRSGLLLYADGPPPDDPAWNDCPPNVFIFPLRSFFQALRSRTFPEVVRDLINRRVHGTRP